MVISNGTAALHAVAAALEIGAGDEVIVPAITFVATANCVVYQGGTPVFADVEPDTAQAAEGLCKRLTRIAPTMASTRSKRGVTKNDRRGITAMPQDSRFGSTQPSGDSLKTS